MIQEGQVIAVLRRCRVCLRWWALEHYLLHGKVCVGCRGRFR